jgi:hypothetical protein
MQQPKLFCPKLRVNDCVSRQKFLWLCREPHLISGWLGDCGQWRRNFKQGRPSKRRNAGLPITRWRILSALSRSH